MTFSEFIFDFENILWFVSKFRFLWKNISLNILNITKKFFFTDSNTVDSRFNEVFGHQVKLDKIHKIEIFHFYSNFYYITVMKCIWKSFQNSHLNLVFSNNICLIKQLTCLALLKQDSSLNRESTVLPFLHDKNPFIS